MNKENESILPIPPNTPPLVGTYEVYHLLREFISDYIYTGHFRFLNEEGFDVRGFDAWASDFYRLGYQQNIQAFTKSLQSDHDAKEFVKSMMLQDRISTRYEFLAKATAYLKFTIGHQRWSTLIDDLVGSLSLHDIKLRHDYDATKSLLNDINRKQSEVDESLLRHNHWLVSFILYGIMPDTIRVVAGQISSISRMYMDTSKSHGNVVRRML